MKEHANRTLAVAVRLALAMGALMAANVAFAQDGSDGNGQPA